MNTLQNITAARLLKLGKDHRSDQAKIRRLARDLVRAERVQGSQGKEVFAIVDKIRLASEQANARRYSGPESQQRLQVLDNLCRRYRREYQENKAARSGMRWETIQATRAAERRARDMKADKYTNYL
jgi:hypothetical protein